MASLNGSAFLSEPKSGTRGGYGFFNQPGVEQAVDDLGLKQELKKNVQDEDEKRKKMLEDWYKNNPQFASGGSMSAVAELFG